jgi:hypothetical protein
MVLWTNIQDMRVEYMYRNMTGNVWQLQNTKKSKSLRYKSLNRIFRNPPNLGRSDHICPNH